MHLSSARLEDVDDRRPRPTPRPRGFTAMVVAVAFALVASGCGNDALQNAAFETKVLPMVFKLLKDRAVALPFPANLAVYAGLFYAEQVAKERATDREATYLLIEQELSGRTEIRMFRIDSNRKLVIYMNGKFVQEIEQNLITIKVDTTVDSTIVVADAAGDVVRQEGQFHLADLTGARRAIDLDSGEIFEGDARNTDPSIDMNAGFDGLANGALIAPWQDDGQPTREGCVSIPEPSWYARAGFWDVELGPWCVRTSEGRFGLLKLRWDLGYQYVIWEDPHR